MVVKVLLLIFICTFSIAYGESINAFPDILIDRLFVANPDAKLQVITGIADRITMRLLGSPVIRFVADN